ncbi:hypothetical protein MHJ94_10715 [Chryseobacterium taklimakanense]|uniref:hypothetical protein n=1 Tax=Chryseobacterium taklimakanense TaxID=536441 RepID=UPI001EF71653|nr:hypothetical protein [Chryseobacterium taklimakanense]MCG7281762.1 hypothetical protein [Chryseobacterium taklimakanense]
MDLNDEIKKTIQPLIEKALSEIENKTDNQPDEQESEAVRAWKEQKAKFAGKSLDDFQKSIKPKSPDTPLGGKAI